MYETNPADRKSRLSAQLCPEHSDELSEELSGEF
jgi:hypothetical protein